MKSLIGILVIALLVGGLLFALNPSMDDFGAFYQKKAEKEAAQSVSGGLGKLVAGMAKGAASLAANAYTRKDFVLFSTYTLGKASDPSERYLGVAKIFIKVK